MYRSAVTVASYLKFEGMIVNGVYSIFFLLMVLQQNRPLSDKQFNYTLVKAVNYLCET